MPPAFVFSVRTTPTSLANSLCEYSAIILAYENEEYSLKDALKQINCEKIVLVNFNFYFSEICGVFFRRSVFFLVYVLSNKFELLYETDK